MTAADSEPTSAVPRALGLTTLTPDPQGRPVLPAWPCVRPLGLYILFHFYFYLRDGKWFPSSDGGGEGSERLAQRKQTELIFQGLCTWGFFPLKTQQAEVIDFNYIDLQFLIVVALSLGPLGANYRFSLL